MKEAVKLDSYLYGDSAAYSNFTKVDRKIKVEELKPLKTVDGGLLSENEISQIRFENLGTRLWNALFVLIVITAVALPIIFYIAPTIESVEYQNEINSIERVIKSSDMQIAKIKQNTLNKFSTVELSGFAENRLNMIVPYGDKVINLNRKYKIVTDGDVFAVKGIK
ncbi:MAG: hypothetical protein CSB15_00045 [Clostridiales bacterium]|nr:MAG: hypothetical protein CSB15_00045 [Clostridiales bacterium]